MEHVLLGFVSFAGGLIIAFGLVAVILGLNLIPRFAGVTHTAHRIHLYEKCVIAGAILGNILTVYAIRFPAGGFLAGCIGLFGGIYLGSWIVALTEMVDMFPILSRKSDIKIGIGAIILTVAIGKTIFSLLYYYRGW